MNACMIFVEASMNGSIITWNDDLYSIVEIEITVVTMLFFQYELIRNWQLHLQSSRGPDCWNASKPDLA